MDGKPYLAHDWSPDGFSITYAEEKLEVGSEVRGEIDIYQATEKGQFTGRVIRHTEANTLAVQFNYISAQSFVMLCVLLGLSEEQVH